MWWKLRTPAVFRNALRCRSTPAYVRSIIIMDNQRNLFVRSLVLNWSNIYILSQRDSRGDFKRLCTEELLLRNLDLIGVLGFWSKIAFTRERTKIVVIEHPMKSKHITWESDGMMTKNTFEYLLKSVPQISNLTNNSTIWCILISVFPEK